MVKRKSLKSVVSASPAPSVVVERKPSKEDIEREKKWRAEDDIRTLQRAEEIKRDKERMTMAKRVAKDQVQDLKKIC